MKIKIVKYGINGEGIGYLDKKPIFVPGALKNEVVDIEILSDYNKYAIGKVKSIVKSSGNRLEPSCPYNQKCGGCPLIITNYENQRYIKKQLLQETLIKYCGYQGKIEDVKASSKDLYYRNKCNLPFVDHQGKLANGLYQANSNIPVSIEKCQLHTTKLEKVRLAVLGVLNRHSGTTYDYKSKKGYRQLMIRGFQQNFQVVLITGQMTISQRVIDELMAIEGVSSLYQGINIQKNPVKLMPEKIERLAGSNSIPFQLGAYQFQLTPQAFFQLNQFTAEKLYQTLLDCIEEKVNLLVEAYCGIGAISLFLHDKANQIIGVDIEKSAICDAKLNARINKIENIDFRLGDASSQLTSIMKQSTIDVLVVDPPRKGIDENLLQTIQTNKVKKILYVSCNPATLAKNLNTLSEHYEIKKVIPFDMFPQTPLVETLVVLEYQENYE